MRRAIELSAFVCLGLTGLLSLTAASGCSDDSEGIDGQTDDDGDNDGSGSEDAQEGGEGSGEGSCDVAECQASCAEEIDACGDPWVGSCEDGACVCAPAGTCEPCVEEECETWMLCATEYGECSYGCGSTREMSWAPAASCVLDMDGFPASFADVLRITILDVQQGVEGSGCEDPEVDWVWAEDLSTITLCPDFCALFEEAGTVTLEWTVPCE
ncbi:hypothetical protein G6O69_10430 [Pseudenhygromyxa sp. WMMC2535]|uniref:hypothetical protein n=1 Tax=Pseudenhygromyxa sp. WMMC2535 TaxID=2712867 RepID=UPI001555A805|nr:hypothetical protein [Pseudenhygromyxa sp. WMMC2535]NVB38247.1 hypothetical protein [Pseudenhygromyxa sp. WMMC2535]